METKSYRTCITDAVTTFCGSWLFISMQTIGFSGWIIGNTTGFFTFDPAPYIGLNLILSFIAAYTGPFVMISQNRQQERDRKTITDDFKLDRHIDKEVADLKKIMLEIQHKLNRIT